jgi:hypothetical protein
MTHILKVPTLDNGYLNIELTLGSSTFLVGPNGSGKSRLAVFAEQQFERLAHRISAHRSMSLNPTVAKISAEKAISGLRFGRPDIPADQGFIYRHGSRWSSNFAISQTLLCKLTTPSMQVIGHPCYSRDFKH